MGKLLWNTGTVPELRIQEGRKLGLLLHGGTPRVDVSTRPDTNVAGTLLPERVVGSTECSLEGFLMRGRLRKI
jgi:hypothetical protein